MTKVRGARPIDQAPEVENDRGAATSSRLYQAVEKKKTCIQREKVAKKQHGTC